MFTRAKHLNIFEWYCTIRCLSYVVIGLWASVDSEAVVDVRFAICHAMSLWDFASSLQGFKRQNIMLIGMENGPCVDNKNENCYFDVVQYMVGLSFSSNVSGQNWEFEGYSITVLK